MELSLRTLYFQTMKKHFKCELMKSKGLSLLKRYFIHTRHFHGKLINLYSPVVNGATERVWKIVWCSRLVVSDCHRSVPLVVSKIIRIKIMLILN